MVQTDQPDNTRPRETPAKHLKSFGWMLLITAIAFSLVGTGIFPPWITFSIIVLLAFIQLVLQLTTFMHLDRRSQLPIVFMTAGIGFSVIIAVAMFLMRN